MSKKIKTSFLVLALLVIGAVGFKLGYYDVEKQIEEVDESFFITKHSDINKNDKNLLSFIKDINYDIEEDNPYLKGQIVDCLYKNECLKKDVYLDLQAEPFNVKNEFLQEESKIREVKDYLYKNNILFDFNDSYNIRETELIDKTKNKSIFKHNPGETLEYKNLFRLFRESWYKTLFYLENNEEIKAVELMSSKIQIGLTILEGDTGFIDTFAAESLLQMIFDNLSVLITNFDLTKESKTILVNVLNKTTEYSSAMDNALKNHYLYMDNPKFLLLIEGSYNHEYTKRGVKEIIKEIILTKGNLSNETVLKYGKVNSLKSNKTGQKIWKGYVETPYSDLYIKLKELENYKNKLVNELK